MESGTTHDMTFTDVVRAEDLASYFARTGDAREALRWARHAYELSPTGIEVRVLESELFDRVRDDPVFSREIGRIRDAIWDRVQQAASNLKGER